MYSEGLRIGQVQTSCGFGVPLLGRAPDADGGEETKPVLLDRDTMGRWARKKIETDSLGEYQAEKNARSLDGCPGLRSAMRERGDWVWLVLLMAWVRRMRGQREAMGVGAVIGMVVVLGGQMVLGRLGFV